MQYSKGLCQKLPTIFCYYTNSIYILVQKNHAKPLWSKGAKNTIGPFYICKWYYISAWVPHTNKQQRLIQLVSGVVS